MYFFSIFFEGGYHFVAVEGASKKEPTILREVDRIVASSNNNKLKYSIVDGDRFKVFHMDENKGQWVVTNVSNDVQVGGS